MAVVFEASYGAPSQLTMADGRHRLYGDLAFLWPLMSPPDEYLDEAHYWRQALRQRLGPGRLRILDLGAGGGHNLHHLAREFDATAVDLSAEMLAHSRRLNPAWPTTWATCGRCGWARPSTPSWSTTPSRT